MKEETRKKEKLLEKRYQGISQMQTETILQMWQFHAIIVFYLEADVRFE